MKCSSERRRRLTGHQADMDDVASLKAATEGSYAVFAVTNCKSICASQKH